MLTFEEVQEILTEIADDLPDEIYTNLNGGIILQPGVKFHPEGRANDLYILGEYHYRPYTLGRYISIYYGSFSRLHGHLSPEQQKEKLKEVLYHELTHHLEHQAGDKSLEKQDDVDLARYKSRARPRTGTEGSQKRMRIGIGRRKPETLEDRKSSNSEQRSEEPPVHEQKPDETLGQEQSPDKPLRQEQEPDPRLNRGKRFEVLQRPVPGINRPDENKD